MLFMSLSSNFYLGALTHRAGLGLPLPHHSQEGRRAEWKRSRRKTQEDNGCLENNETTCSVSELVAPWLPTCRLIFLSSVVFQLWTHKPVSLTPPRSNRDYSLRYKYLKCQCSCFVKVWTLLWKLAIAFQCPLFFFCSHRYRYFSMLSSIFKHNRWVKIPSVNAEILH